MLSENLVSNPGEYRSDNTITKWYDIPREIRELINFMNSRDYRPVERAAFSHYRIVQIQLFPNFNNAVARLIMNFILIRHHYPLTIIKSDDKQDYLDCLSKSNPIYFLQFVTRCVLNASQSCLNRTRERLDLNLPSIKLGINHAESEGY